jgi:phosphodiesterase/alkaline phosphatase D-like protein
MLKLLAFDTSKPASMVYRFNLAPVVAVCLLLCSLFVHAQAPAPGFATRIPAPSGSGAQQVPVTGALDIAISGNYAYVVTGANEFYILDISTPSSPLILGKLTHGSGGALLKYASGVFVSGNYAYVAAQQSNALEIIDISNVAAPVHAGSIVDSPTGAELSTPQDVVVVGNLAYVARQGGLEIVDVTSKTAPVHLSKLDFGLGFPSKGIDISGNYLFINNAIQFSVINVSDPANPAVAATVSDDGNNVRINEPSAPVVSGNFLYMTTKGYSTLEVFDISTPTAPVPAGHIGNGENGSVLVDPDFVSISGNYAFVTNRTENTLEVIDISTPTSPTHATKLSTGSGFSFLEGALSIAVSGNYAYIGCTNEFEVFYIYTPSPPTAQTAIASDPGTFMANWSAVDNATGYELDISADNFSTFLSGYPKSLASSVTSSQVTGLDAATTYKYRVRATNGNGASPNSVVISTTPTPAAPVITLSDVNEFNFKISWTAIPGAAGYIWQIDTNDTFTGDDIHPAGLPDGTIDTFIVVPQLVPGTNYYIRIAAGNSSLIGPWSQTVNALMPPPAPTINTPSLSDITQNSFLIDLVLYTGTQFEKLDVATDAVFTSILPEYDDLTVPVTNKKTVTGLQPNTAYYVRMRSGVSDGVSTNSLTVIYTTLPDVMEATASTSPTQGTFVANWTEVPGVNNYYLDVSLASNFDVIVPTYNNRSIPKTASNLTVSGLDPGTTYYYRIRCSNVSGTSPNSNVVTATTLPVVPTLNDPLNVTISGFTASWSASTGATDYFVDVATNNAFTSLVTGYDNKSTTNQTAIGITGLDGNSTYYYRVRASNAAGSTVSTAGKLVITAPLAPVAIAATNPGQTTLTANWNAVPNVTDYRIDLSSDETFITNNVVANVLVSGVTSLDVTGLTPGTLYYYRVRAVNATAASVDSNVISQITVPATPIPSAASPIGQNAFTASWTSVTGASGYFVDVKNENGNLLSGYDNLSVSSGNAVLVNTGIEAGTSYSFVVRATNAAGTTPSSNSQAVLTVPPTPVAKAADLSGTLSFKANWESSKSATGYHINVYNGQGSLLPGYSNFDAGDTQSTTVTVNAPATGATFSYKVSATNSSGTSEFSEAITVNTPATSFPSINLPTGGTVASYMIVSIPVGTTASSTLAAESFIKTWRAMQYDNATDHNVDVPDLSKMEPGKGYWVNSNLDEAPTITVTGATTPADKTLTLKPGWNQVGNPLNFDISWADVLDNNSAVTNIGNLYTYNIPVAGSGFAQYDKLKAYGGGFVNNTNTSDVQLTIPTDLQVTSGRISRSNVIDGRNIGETEWFLPITLQFNGHASTLSGIGMHPDAKKSIDKFDAIALPRLFDFAEISSSHPEFFQPRFMRDVVTTTSSYVWKVDVNVADGSEASLSWDNSDWTSAALYLIDDEAGTLLDMSKVSTYNFSLRRTRSLRFAFSKDGLFSPDLSALGQPYPNPSAGRVTFPFIGGEEEQINVQIIDVTGRVVSQLKNASVKPGYNDIVWDAGLTAGVYLYQVRSSNGLYKTGRIVIR